MSPISKYFVRIAVLCVGLLVVCGCLSGCAHDQSADGKNSATPSATETTIAPPEGDMWPYPTPTLPPEASRDDSAGACAVAAYFLEAIAYDATHMRTDTYEKYAADDCQRCRDTMNGIEKLRYTGAWIRGHHYQDIQLLGADKLTDYDNGWVCDFAVQQDGVEAWKPGRDAPYRGKGYSGTTSVFLNWVGDSWKVVDYGHDDAADKK